MAENVESEPELPTVFNDSGDEGSFGGFEGRCRDYGSDSDVDLVGLGDDGGGPASGGTDSKKEEAQWTDHLSDFSIPGFTAASDLNFSLPDIPNPLDYFLVDELWDLIETDGYICQKLSN